MFEGRAVVAASYLEASASSIARVKAALACRRRFKGWGGCWCGCWCGDAGVAAGMVRAWVRVRVRVEVSAWHACVSAGRACAPDREANPFHTAAYILRCGGRVAVCVWLHVRVR